MAAAALLSAIQRLRGLPIGDHSAYTEIIGTPLPFRMFLVLTAGIAEEVLYRGGSSALAAFVSTCAFVAAHFRWRTSHLVQVAAAGTILSVTYVAGSDLWAWIIAHTMVDAIGFILVLILLAERSARQPAGAD